MSAEEMDAWNAKYEKMVAHTTRYIKRYSDKATKCTDPEKLAKYSSKITRAITIFQQSISEINTKSNSSAQEAERCTTIKCTT